MTEEPRFHEQKDAVNHGGNGNSQDVKNIAGKPQPLNQRQKRKHNKWNDAADTEKSHKALKHLAVFVLLLLFSSCFKSTAENRKLIASRSEWNRQNRYDDDYNGKLFIGSTRQSSWIALQQELMDLARVIAALPAKDVPPPPTSVLETVADIERMARGGQWNILFFTLWKKFAWLFVYIRRIFTIFTMLFAVPGHHHVLASIRSLSAIHVMTHDYLDQRDYRNYYDYRRDDYSYSLSCDFDQLQLRTRRKEWKSK